MYIMEERKMKIKTTQAKIQKQNKQTKKKQKKKTLKTKIKTKHKIFISTKGGDICCPKLSSIQESGFPKIIDLLESSCSNVNADITIHKVTQ